MMLSLIYIVPLLFTLYIGNICYVLLRNYLVARKSGLPVVVLPLNRHNPLWMIFSIPNRAWLKKHLPYDIYAWIALVIYGSEQHEKRIYFNKLKSDSFILVTSCKNEIWTQDPEFVYEVMRRPNDFCRMPEQNFVVDIFGKNVFTSEGEAWTRQRKLITAIINERISTVVFEESWRQSREMMKDVEGGSEDSKKTDSSKGTVYAPTFTSMKRIASNVLFRSAYGLPQPFKEPPRQPQNELRPKFDMLESLQIILKDVVPAAFFSTRIIMNWPMFLPGAKWLRDIGMAVDQFPGLVDKRLDEERQALREAKGSEARSNLTSMLIRASEHDEEESGEITTKSGKKAQTLSQDELRGNLFLFTTAGFETTANALTFALMILMAEPEWQEWLFEEIDALFNQEEQLTKSTGKGDQDVDYAAFFPKAIRCLSFMMEILRVYSPVPHLSRETAPLPLSIKSGDKTYTIPPNTQVFVPMCPIHTDPKVWRNLNQPESKAKSEASEETLQDCFDMRQDEYVFRPPRWINEQHKEMPDGSLQKTMFQPPRGTFLPFAGGPRVCPGQKMAQVEFVSVILALLRDHRIEAVKKSGETDEQLRHRLHDVLSEVHAEVTLVMEKMDEVDVRFVQRKKTVV